MGGKTDVWQGTLALMALRTLETMGPQHGYGLARRIEQTSGDLLELNYGTLYPALLKLEQEGYIRSRLGPLREQSQGQILRAHQGRPTPGAQGRGRVGADHRNPGTLSHPSRGGIMDACHARLRALWMRLLGLFLPRRGDDDFAPNSKPTLPCTPMTASAPASTRGSPPPGPHPPRRRRADPSGAIANGAACPGLNRSCATSLTASYARQTSAAQPPSPCFPSASASAPTPPSFPWSAASSFAPRRWAIPSTLLALQPRKRATAAATTFPIRSIAICAIRRSLSPESPPTDELIPASINGNGEPERVWGQSVTTNFFDVLALPMVLGRGSSPGDESAPVIVLGQDSLAAPL